MKAEKEVLFVWLVAQCLSSATRLSHRRAPELQDHDLSLSNQIIQGWARKEKNPEVKI